MDHSKTGLPIITFRELVQYSFLLCSFVLMTLQCGSVQQSVPETTDQIRWISVKTGLTDSTTVFSQPVQKTAAQLENTGVEITWSPVKGAAYYEVRMSSLWAISSIIWDFLNDGMRVEAQSLDTMRLIIAPMKPSVDTARCIYCLKCSIVCPQAAINYINERAVIDPAKCIRCGKCFAACPPQAIADRFMGKGYYYGVAAFNKDGKLIAGPLATSGKYTLRYTNVLYINGEQICDKCGAGCHMFIGGPNRRCPVNALWYDTSRTTEKGMVYIDLTKCTSCGRCMNICVMTNGRNSIRKEVVKTD
jgi:ferredoxin